MYPHSHFLFPLFIGLLLEYFGYVDYVWIAVAVLVGVFVDIDHPLSHFLHTGELGLRNAWNAAVVKHEPERTVIHHKEGILVIGLSLLIAYAYWPYWVSAIVLGYFSHMFLDHYSLTRGFIDYLTDEDYWGSWKPVTIAPFGFVMHLAKHEIVLDVVTIIGILAIFIV